MEGRDAPIVLTGTALDRDEASDELRDVSRGDIKVYERLDEAGRAAVRGGNANYGYSGYFRGLVYDGRRWRNLKLWELVPETDRQYATQAEKAATLERLRADLRALAGRKLVWRDRAFHLHVEGHATDV